MADTLNNPHHLVALMSYAFWGDPDSSPRQLDSARDMPQFGIRNSHDTNVRTFPILDALAHISISKDRSQVVAIGLQLNCQTEQIRLTVAENSDVMDGLVSHLEKVWGKLRCLSDGYARQRTGDLELYQSMSPEMPPQVGLPLRISIFRDIYQYSMEKQMKRINKWYNSLARFVMGFVSQQRETNLSPIQQTLYDFATLLSLVVLSLRRSHQNQLTTVEWVEIYNRTMLANQKARFVLADRAETGCEILVHELQGYHKGMPFQLRRALEKLTSLSRHIDILFGFAHSPRLRRAFKYELLVAPVPKQNRTVKFPTSEVQWNSIFDAANGDYDKSTLGISATKLLKRFGTKEWVCPVHSECGLILYLHTNQGDRWDNAPPFGYIGVSKLSCSACRLWIEVFNEEHIGPKFYTRGSHGKYYWPWGAPSAEGFTEGVSWEKKMADKALTDYRARLAAWDKNRQRSTSDSTDASASGERGRIDPNDAERIMSNANAKAKRIGGTPLGLFSFALENSGQHERPSTE